MKNERLRKARKERRWTIDATEALQITALTKSPSMFQYLLDFRRQLKSGQEAVEVKHFDEQIRLVSHLIERVKE